MTRLPLLFVFLASAVLGQTTADCTQTSSYTAAVAGGALIANSGGGNGCSTFRLTFWSTGFSAYTISLQGSLDNSTFADITTASSILEGVNPTSWSSSTTDSSIVIRAYFPYYRVNVSSVTGSGTIHALLLGYKGTSPAPGGGAGGSSTVIIGGNGTLLSGQQGVTGSAVALATHTTKSVCVKANLGNTINVYAGPAGITTSTGLEIPPGGGFCQNLTNTNLVYVVASTTGATVSWIASN